MSLTNEYLCYMEIDKTSVICDTAECSCDTKENNGSDSCSLNICAMRMVINSYKLYPESSQKEANSQLREFLNLFCYICDTYCILTDIKYFKSIFCVILFFPQESEYPVIISKL